MLFWLAVACCVVAQVAITAVATREARPAQAEGDLPIPSRVAETAWSLVPAALLALVLLMTWNAIRLNEAGGTPAPAAPAITDTRAS